MIVIPIVKGDGDMEVAGKQHDVYHQALGIIVSKCNRYTEFARSLLDDADHSEWGTVDGFDHRTLQHAHDLLAAVWRLRNDFREAALPFVEKNSLDEVQTLWLDWLRHEIAGWIDYPHRVCFVQLILTNQNELPGHIAEAQLSLDIINWFTDVPWDQEWREAYEATIAECRENLRRAVRDGWDPRGRGLIALERIFLQLNQEKAWRNGEYLVGELFSNALVQTGSDTPLR